MARQKKDSGVEWIGRIPDNWSARMLFQIFSEVKNKNEGLIETNLLSLSYGKIKRKDIDSSFGLLPESFEGYNIIEKDDIVLRLTDLQNDQRSLRTGLAGEKGIVTSAYTTLRRRTTEAAPSFMHYCLHAFDVCKGFYGMGAGVRQGLNWSGIRKLVIPWCSEPEQCRISVILDLKCAEIDKVVEQTRATIEEYKKLKQAIITEAVTKGVRGPRPMKPSGVEWIGDIPEEWTRVKLKSLISHIESGVSVNAGVNPAGEGEIGVLKTSCVSFGRFNPDENKSVNKEEIARVSCPVQQGCLIVSRMNTPELVGACGYVQEERMNIYLPDRLWQVHISPNYSSKYIYYYLSSKITRSYYASIAVGTSSSMQNISQEDFCCMYCTCPRYEEQQEIAAYLDTKCTEIDRIIEKKEQLIEELGSYKKSLIYEYVTGKKEVTA